MAITIYVVENVALLMGFIFTFVLEIHRLISARSLSILPIPKKKNPNPLFGH